MKAAKYFFNEEIVELTLKNTFFRKEVFTGNHSQIVLMSVAPGQEIGKEIHHVDQILFFVDGQGVAILNDVQSDVFPYHMVFVPSGVEHNFKNTGPRDMKICTIYAPAEHKPGTEEEKKS
jgi:mannose-6-phosphate isomerase-like protein (cupin superfamily)